MLDTLRIPNEGEPLYVKGKFIRYTVSSNAYGPRRIDDSHEAHVFAFKRSILTLPYFAQCGEAIWWHTLSDTHSVTHKCMCRDCAPPPPPPPRQPPPQPRQPSRQPPQLGFHISFGTLARDKPKVYPYGKIGTYKGQKAVVGKRYIKHNITHSEPIIVDAQKCDAPDYKLGIDGTKHTYTTTRKYWIHTKQENILADDHAGFIPKKQRIADCTLEKIKKYLGSNCNMHCNMHCSSQPPIPADIHPRQNVWLEGEEEHEKSIPFKERNPDVLRVPQRVLKPIQSKQFIKCLKRKRCMDETECRLKLAKFF